MGFRVFVLHFIKHPPRPTVRSTVTGARSLSPSRSSQTKAVVVGAIRSPRGPRLQWMRPLFYLALGAILVPMRRRRSGQPSGGEH